MNNKIVGLVGFISSGKGTVADILQTKYGFTEDSFAASLKDACAPIFGWDREMLEGKTPESRAAREVPDPFWCERLGRPDFTPRLALQLVGTEVFRNGFHQDIWINSMERRLLGTQHNIVISDVRFQNEIQLIQQLGGHIMRIRRGPEPEWFDIAQSANAGNTRSRTIMKHDYANIHASEWGWVGCEPDFLIENDADLATLEARVDQAIKAI